jgi:hypothetical protein
MISSDKAIEKIVKVLFFAGLVAGAVGIIIFSWQQHLVFGLKADTSLMGDLGSFFSGTVGAIWSLASIILFYLALKEQRRDIKINQDALNLQIDELEQTRYVYLEQSDIFRIQTFENTFFQLLQLHSSTVNNLVYAPGFPDPPSHGKLVFDDWKEQLDLISQGYTPDSISQDELGFPVEQEFIAFTDLDTENTKFNSLYKESYKAFENILSHYFRQLYHIFK